MKKFLLISLIFLSFVLKAEENLSFSEKISNNEVMLEEITVKNCKNFDIIEFTSKQKKLCLEVLKVGVIKNKPYSNYIFGQSLISGVNVEKNIEKGVEFILKASQYPFEKASKIEKDYIFKAKEISK